MQTRKRASRAERGLAGRARSLGSSPGRRLSKSLALVLCALLMLSLTPVPVVYAERSVGDFIADSSAIPFVAETTADVSDAESGGWEWQNPVPPGIALLSVAAIGENTAITVGGSGAIYRTTDDGATWTAPSSDTTMDLYSIHFANPTTGWVVGQGGTILKTTNGGLTWTAQDSGTTGWLLSVHFVDTSTGWAVGQPGLILKTTNGGATWTPQDSGSSAWLISVHFANSSTGWAVGQGGTILKTTNGGSTWTVQDSGTSSDLCSVYMLDSTTGWIVGWGGTILKTTNGGSTWTAQDSGTEERLYGVHFVDANTGWAVGYWDTVLKTSNGGETWIAQGPGEDLDFRSVRFVSTTTGWAVGMGGAVYKTTDGGTTWASRSSGNQAHLQDVHFADTRTGWAVGTGGTILATTNGGATWSTQGSGTTGTLWSVHSTDTSTGWVVGEGGVILKTTNGGATWSVQSSGTSNTLYSVHFANSNTGWAVGAGGTIRKTTDGGATWSAQSSGTTKTLRAVHFVGTSVGRVVGNSYAWLLTTNGGASWQNEATGLTDTLLDVHFIDGNTGWVVGVGTMTRRWYQDGVVWWTTWYAQGGRAVHMIDAATVYRVDDWSRVTKTTDAGETWVVEPTGSQYPLNAIHFVDADTGWVVGNRGAILRYGDVEALPTIDIQHDAAGVVFDRWVTGYSTAYSGGGYVYGRWTGTELTARFTGSRIRWVGPKQPSYGMADVYIDGVRVAENVDCYAPATEATLDAIIWESGTLTDGPHTITLKLKGNRNASSTGNVVVIDRFEVDGADPKGGGVRIDDAAAAPGYTGNWISAINPTYYDKTYSYSRWAGHVFSVTFEGTKVAWLGPMTPFYGKAEIWLDGSYVTTVDAYSATQGWRERIWESQTLSPGTHTFEIRPTGEKNPASTSANVVVDAVDVIQ